MAEDETGEKSEEPTPKRKEEARKEGQVAQSAEIASAAVLLSALLVMHANGRGMLRSLEAMAWQSLRDVAGADLTVADTTRIFADMFWTLLDVSGPILGLTAAVALAVAALQVGFILSPKAIKPSLGKLSPLGGLKRIFSSHGLIELLKSSLKIALVGWVSYKLIAGSTAQIAALVSASTGQILSFGASELSRLVLWAAALLSALAGADYAWQRYSHNKSLKMSKQEVKEERRQTEGDPLVKSRFRQAHTKLARRRMLEEVPKAHVVVTNPVHLAVALRYVAAEMPAPKVVAKGAEDVALKIREIARRCGIPIVERRSLARALFRTVRIGETIPSSLFRAVAEILAYVYSLRPNLMASGGAER